MGRTADRVPASIADGLDGADDATLQATIDYAQSLLDADGEDEAVKETVADREPPEEWDGDVDEWREATADSEAPKRATLTTKTIKDNDYLYWQWSEGDKTKSEYIGPKNPKR